MVIVQRVWNNPKPLLNPGLLGEDSIAGSNVFSSHVGRRLDVGSPRVPSRLSSSKNSCKTKVAPAFEKLFVSDTLRLNSANRAGSFSICSTLLWCSSWATGDLGDFAPLELLLF